MRHKTDRFSFGIHCRMALLPTRASRLVHYSLVVGFGVVGLGAIRAA